MIVFFEPFNPVPQALIATLFIRGVTAAGTMIFVVVEELIPETQRKYENIDLVTMTTMIGFSVMMTLDVAPG